MIRAAVGRYRRRPRFRGSTALDDIATVSSVGSPLHTSLVQTAAAQQVAGPARDRERDESQRTQRATDQVELRIAGVESDQALRELPHNDSEQADTERREKGEQYPRIDLRA
jgi:hypothetical protein